MNEDFLSFKNFPDKETANDFAEVLSHRQIGYFIEENILNFDPSYAFHPLNRDYSLKIRPADFETATKTYEDYFANLIDRVDAEYYLFSFSDEELKEIIAKPDEWGSFDYELAQKILKDRGTSISEEMKLELKVKRYAELTKPEKDSAPNIVGFYILATLFFPFGFAIGLPVVAAILYSPVGFIIGYIWAYSKKTLPDGRRVLIYSPKLQRHGKRIIKIVVFLIVISILLTIV